MKDIIKRQKEEIEEKLIQMEIHQRKQNLLVYGVPDKQKEDITSTTREILSHFLQVTPEEAGKIPLVNAHRLPTAQRGKQPTGQPKNEPCPIIIILFLCLTATDFYMHTNSNPAKINETQL